MNRNSDEKEEKFVEQTLSLKEQEKVESGFRFFLDKVNEAEISVQEQGYFTEEEVETELAKI